jgi:FAD/FMN-containing dehydrogenase
VSATRHFDTVLANLPPADAGRLDKPLLRMDVPAGAAGRPLAFVRRQVMREELSDDQWTLTQRLAGRRLLALDRASDGVETCELTHERLAHRWPSHHERPAHGIKTVLTGIRMPRMNSIMERWVRSWRHEVLDRCLVWNERHLRHAPREYEHFYNQHRAHQALAQAAPPRPVPHPITNPQRMIDLNIRRRDRLGGVLHEYSHVA